MNIYDILIGAVLAVVLIFAVRGTVKNKGKSCCGDCSNCMGCSK